MQQETQHTSEQQQQSLTQAFLYTKDNISTSILAHLLSCTVLWIIQNTSKMLCVNLLR